MPPPPEALPETSLDQSAATITAAELDEFVAALPDDALAHAVLAGLRQMRRRAARASRAGKGRGVAPLERGLREIAALLGGSGSDEF